MARKNRNWCFIPWPVLAKARDVLNPTIFHKQLLCLFCFLFLNQLLMQKETLSFNIWNNLRLCLIFFYFCCFCYISCDYLTDHFTFRLIISQWIEALKYLSPSIVILLGPSERKEWKYLQSKLLWRRSDLSAKMRCHTAKEYTNIFC